MSGMHKERICFFCKSRRVRVAKCGIFFVCENCKKTFTHPSFDFPSDSIPFIRSKPIAISNAVLEYRNRPKEIPKELPKEPPKTKVEPEPQPVSVPKKRKAKPKLEPVQVVPVLAPEPVPEPVAVPVVPTPVPEPEPTPIDVKISLEGE